MLKSIFIFPTSWSMAHTITRGSSHNLDNWFNAVYDWHFMLDSICARLTRWSTNCWFKHFSLTHTITLGSPHNLGKRFDAIFVTPFTCIWQYLHISNMLKHHILSQNTSHWHTPFLVKPHNPDSRFDTIGRQEKDPQQDIRELRASGVFPVRQLHVLLVLLIAAAARSRAKAVCVARD